MSPMTEHDQSKKFADKSAATANKAFATVEQSARAVEQTYSVSLENIRAFNLKMIDMARANVEAVLDLSQQIATSKAPSDIVELWTTHAHKQFEMLSEQSKELAALAHKMAGESAETMTRSVNQVFQKASSSAGMPGGSKKWETSMQTRHDQQKPAEGRQLLEFIGREIKTHIDLAEPIPERLNELIEQLVRRINEREKESE